MYLLPHTHILFENNHALYVGGAIHSDIRSWHDQCFFHVVSPELKDTVDIIFINNTAEHAGSSLYGFDGSCQFLDMFHDIFNITNTETDPSAIASDPGDVCFCREGKKQPSCFGYDFPQIHAYPGQEFSLPLAVVNDRKTFHHGVVPGIIGAAVIQQDSIATLGLSQVSQASDKPYCQLFNYSVSSGKVAEAVSIELFTEESYFDGKKRQVDVQLMECPLGFPLSQILGKCLCDSASYHYDVECNNNNYTFWRSASSMTWIGFIDSSSNASNRPGAIYHSNCPIGYCSRRDVSITSNTSDDQCEPHRTGLLCSKCEEGYSLTLGSGKCLLCSNTYLLLIVPFTLVGLFLVAILFALNLTVREGTINGLIFYGDEPHSTAVRRS